jgi:hypothetical protein
VCWIRDRVIAYEYRTLSAITRNYLLKGITNGDGNAESRDVTTTGQFVRTRTNSYIGRMPDNEELK